MDRYGAEKKSKAFDAPKLFIKFGIIESALGVALAVYLQQNADDVSKDVYLILDRIAKTGMLGGAMVSTAGMWVGILGDKNKK